MKIIEKISNMIEEELEDAEKYIDCAMNYKTDYPSLATTLFKISQEEMVHVNYLHDQVTALINEYRQTKGKPPEKMQAIYDYLHERFTRQANIIKVKQALFK